MPFDLQEIPLIDSGLCEAMCIDAEVHARRGQTLEGLRLLGLMKLSPVDSMKRMITKLMYILSSKTKILTKYRYNLGHHLHHRLTRAKSVIKTDEEEHKIDGDERLGSDFYFTSLHSNS